MHLDILAACGLEHAVDVIAVRADHRDVHVAARERRLALGRDDLGRGLHRSGYRPGDGVGTRLKHPLAAAEAYFESIALGIGKGHIEHLDALRKFICRLLRNLRETVAVEIVATRQIVQRFLAGSQQNGCQQHP